MNDIERTVGDINKVWLAGFKAGVRVTVEQAQQKLQQLSGRSYEFDMGRLDAANEIGSLLNESGAAEKDEA